MFNSYQVQSYIYIIDPLLCQKSAKPLIQAQPYLYFLYEILYLIPDAIKNRLLD